MNEKRKILSLTHQQFQKFHFSVNNKGSNKKMLQRTVRSVANPKAIEKEEVLND